MNIAQYLDSTYLKTPQQSGISEEETVQKDRELAQEAIDHGIFAVMIRPDYVSEIKKYIQERNSNVAVGTVIGFHEGTYSIEEKLTEASKAIEDGADELDFVINYKAYLQGNHELVKEEFLKCTELGLRHHKIVKWIIEIAALTDTQIADLTQKISGWAEHHFDEQDLPRIFVKSSTGFYETQGGKPNGATFEGIRIMLDHAGKLPVKAAGGVRTPEDAEKMIRMGVKRIGTSSALALMKDQSSAEDY
ncbi:MULTISPECIES: deoxyribose-phosphate aldolase [Chryseobacterium]|uniref:Deoxyribose-phosphate aldolase n=1 Tax=Chryseobacterium camelliae TaxID=1265445 RepID=A0ABU0TL21_9FLAO|nr:MULTISPECIES: deoxyribose-phosphate aldolase [Chryseobacterium]MDT3408659.1 deoxyribose-phosphate aldolase [Pseudacidovorax intermedius]MDQ1097486.1 deoxyribose-phosphate aldolase [Chryseobacterium camelliae]MDQ1101415.1 deoxyribose-phosphate aldolase [Chryseobacterium sp. SORGH_AS_1048]MDR6084859.1 deoxyribose-phosphate aldolase [Chryseobacterium sp. SORGH_AS_0909]MDR6129210.1 deoxyribose-phosphate aldolase [Chryseobacterium sp. SORGH_AS_1175]